MEPPSAQTPISIEKTVPRPAPHSRMVANKRRRQTPPPRRRAAQPARRNGRSRRRRSAPVTGPAPRRRADHRDRPGSPPVRPHQRAPMTRSTSAEDTTAMRLGDPALPPVARRGGPVRPRGRPGLLHYTWVTDYNHTRPHQARDMDPPAQRFTPRARRLTRGRGRGRCLARPAGPRNRPGEGLRFLFARERPRAGWHWRYT